MSFSVVRFFQFATGFRKTQGLERAKYSRVGYFIHRIIFCGFALCLLWASSLQICTLIASYYVAVPSFNSVMTSCYRAYHTTMQQKTDYEECVRRQLYQCNQDFEVAMDKQKARVSDLQARNNIIYERFVDKMNNCSSQLARSRKILQSWGGSSNARSIPFQISCSKENIRSIEDWIGVDQSTAAVVSSTTNSYTAKYNSRVSHLANYAYDLSSYNAAYLANKTANLRLASLKVNIDVSSLYISELGDTFDAMSQLADDLVACLSLDSDLSSSCSNYPQTIYQQYQVMKHQVTNQVDEVQSTLNTYKRMVDNYVDDVQDSFDKAALFYKIIMGDNGFMHYITQVSKVIGPLGNQLGFGNLCLVTVPNFCTLSADDWQVSTPSWPDIPEYPSIPDASVLWEPIKSIVNGVDSAIELSAEKLATRLQNWKQDMDLNLIGKVNWIPNDYNPPSYESYNDTREEISVQKQESEMLLNSVRNSFYDVQNSSFMSESFTNLASKVKVNTTAVRSSSVKFLSSFFTYTESYTFGNVLGEWDWILQSFLTLQGILFLFDYIYRGVQSWKLISRFWSRGLIKLPGLKEVGQENNTFGTIFSGTAKCVKSLNIFFYLLPVIWVQVLVLLCVVIAAIWIFAALLVPEYTMYSRTCVHGVSNSTFISRNMVALAINTASISGQSRLEAGLMAYNQVSLSQCDVLGEASRQQYLTLLQDFLDSNTSYSGYVSQTLSATECIDTSALNSAIAQDCCFDYQKNFSHVSKSTLPLCMERNSSSSSKCPMAMQSISSFPTIFLESPTLESNNIERDSQSVCHPTNLLTIDTTNAYRLYDMEQNQWQTVSSSIFDCESLPACSITCEAPSSLSKSSSSIYFSDISSLSKDCSCMAEWYWNGQLLRTSLAVLIFIITNVSRNLICSGLMRILWYLFTPPVVQLATHCDFKGRITVINDNKRNGKHPALKRTDKLYLRKMEMLRRCKAYSKIAFAKKDCTATKPDQMEQEFSFRKSDEEGTFFVDNIWLFRGKQDTLPTEKKNRSSVILHPQKKNKINDRSDVESVETTDQSDDGRDSSLASVSECPLELSDLEEGRRGARNKGVGKSSRQLRMSASQNSPAQMILRDENEKLCKSRQTRIQRNLSSFVLSGWGRLIFGIAINSLWVYLATLWQQNISYDYESPF